jgi:hypothetical protein
MTVARQWLSKHVSAAMNKTTVEELLDAVFSERSILRITRTNERSAEKPMWRRGRIPASRRKRRKEKPQI